MDKRLVLWDIDKTLMDVDGTGFASFSAAFTAFTGLDSFVETRGAGRTEMQWFAETLEANGLHDPGDWFPRFREIQTRELAERTAQMRQHGRVLAGAREILGRCAEHPEIVSSVLTGNSLANAKLKLELFGLTDVLEIASGAYGDDHASRPELVAIAQRRVREATGIEFTAATTVLVGDSVNDVRAAREGGARIVAVATGLADAEELSAAGAPTVFEDLADTDAVMKALLGDD